MVTCITIHDLYLYYNIDEFYMYKGLLGSTKGSKQMLCGYFKVFCRGFHILKSTSSTQTEAPENGGSETVVDIKWFVALKIVLFVGEG